MDPIQCGVVKSRRDISAHQCSCRFPVVGLKLCNLCDRNNNSLLTLLSSCSMMDIQCGVLRNGTGRMAQSLGPTCTQVPVNFSPFKWKSVRATTVVLSGIYTDGYYLWAGTGQEPISNPVHQTRSGSPAPKELQPCWKECEGC